MVSTDSTGRVPAAVSPESITAEEPSKMALATSLTSARVGLGFRSMESSIWVAVITGFPLDTVERMICFWIFGPSPISSSTPRSPLATIIPFAASTISTMFSIPSRFSILAMIAISAPCAWKRLLSRSISEAFLTKDAAKYSTSCTAAKSTSVLSSYSMSSRALVLSGKLTPLLSLSTPPQITLHITDWFPIA